MYKRAKIPAVVEFRKEGNKLFVNKFYRLIFNKKVSSDTRNFSTNIDNKTLETITREFFDSIGLDFDALEETKDIVYYVKHPDF